MNSPSQSAGLDEGPAAESGGGVGGAAAIIRSALVPLVVAYVVFVLAHHRFLSPLRDIPGPFTASLTRLWHVRQIWRGDQQFAMAEAHEKYGGLGSAVESTAAEG